MKSGFTVNGTVMDRWVFSSSKNSVGDQMWERYGEGSATNTIGGGNDEEEEEGPEDLESKPKTTADAGHGDNLLEGNMLTLKKEQRLLKVSSRDNTDFS